MSEIRFYLDENIRPAVEVQLKRANIDVVSALSLNLLGENDLDHLTRATELQSVLCTHDTDFIELAKTHLEHTVIIWGAHEKASVGGWVKALKQIHEQLTAEEMVGRVEFLNVK